MLIFICNFQQILFAVANPILLTEYIFFLTFSRLQIVEQFLTSIRYVLNVIGKLVTIISYDIYTKKFNEYRLNKYGILCW